MPKAAPGSGQSRPTSRAGGAGRPHRRCGTGSHAALLSTQASARRCFRWRACCSPTASVSWRRRAAARSWRGSTPSSPPRPRAVLTRACRGARTVRTACAYLPPACCAYQGHRATCPRGHDAVHVSISMRVANAHAHAHAQHAHAHAHVHVHVHVTCDTVTHQASGKLPADGETVIVAETLRAGYRYDATGAILRRAKVGP